MTVTNASPCRPTRRYGPCTPSTAGIAWLWNWPRGLAPAARTRASARDPPEAGSRASTAAPCTRRTSGANSVPVMARSTSPRRASPCRAVRRTNTRSNSWSCCVVPSGWSGVFSSVSTASTSTPSATSPASSILSPLSTATSRLLPAMSPRVMEPERRSRASPKSGSELVDGGR